MHTVHVLLMVNSVHRLAVDFTGTRSQTWRFHFVPDWNNTGFLCKFPPYLLISFSISTLQTLISSFTVSVHTIISTFNFHKQFFWKTSRQCCYASKCVFLAKNQFSHIFPSPTYPPYRSFSRGLNEKTDWGQSGFQKKRCKRKHSSTNVVLHFQMYSVQIQQVLARTFYFSLTPKFFAMSELFGIKTLRFTKAWALVNKTFNHERGTMPISILILISWSQLRSIYRYQVSYRRRFF